MSDIFPLLLAVVAGIGLGLFFFGGLWLTVWLLPTSSSPALLLLVSFVGRMALTLLAFYFVMAGRWERLLACLAGFLLARTLLLAYPRSPRPERNSEGPQA